MDTIYIVKRGAYSDETDMIAFHEEDDAKSYAERKNKENNYYGTACEYWYQELNKSFNIENMEIGKIIIY